MSKHPVSQTATTKVGKFLDLDDDTARATTPDPLDECCVLASGLRVNE